jgi:hypothetical protein
MVIKTKKVRWAEHVAGMGKMRSTYTILVKILEGTDIDERKVLFFRTVIGYMGVDWILLAQDWFQWRDLVNKVIDLWVE